MQVNMDVIHSDNGLAQDGQKLIQLMLAYCLLHFLEQTGAISNTDT